MRESIGGTWLLSIVIVFIFIFAGYICLSINHSKAFAVKDDILETIERYNGIDLNNVTKSDGNLHDPCIDSITRRLATVSYRTSGNCNNLQNNQNEPERWVGFDREGRQTDTQASYCIKQVAVNSNIKELPEAYYYKVAVFYQLDLPVISYVMSFKVTGDTKILYPNNQGVK